MHVSFINNKIGTQIRVEDLNLGGRGVHPHLTQHNLCKIARHTNMYMTP